MFHRYLLNFFCILILSGLTRAEAMPLKVLFFGDSITKGQGVTADQRWTALVAAHSHGAFVEVNEGKPGRPAAAVGEFSKMLEEYPANSGISVLVIALGTNDSRDTSPNCVRKTAAYLSKMVTMARTREPGWKIVICAPYNINKDALKKSRSIGPIRERNLIGMGKAFKELASREGCGFIDFYGVIPPASLTVDGVHPDAAGHAAIAAFAQPALDGVVAALKKNPS